MESQLTYEQALAALAWHVELGAEDAILDSPVDRYALERADREARAAAASREGQHAPLRGDGHGGPRDSGRDQPRDGANAQAARRPAPIPPAPPTRDPVAEAAAMAAAAPDLDALHLAFAAFDTPMKQGARQFVAPCGMAGAPLMVIGEAPDREDDAAGRAYSGLRGALMDRMMAAIGRDRQADDPARAVYLSFAAPWRLPANRLPDAAELAAIRPFLLRQIALAKPQAILLQGNLACLALLGRGGLTRLRGTWADVAGIPALPSHALDQLMAEPALKRDAWADLLALKSRLP